MRDLVMPLTLHSPVLLSSHPDLLFLQAGKAKHEGGEKKIKKERKKKEG